MRDTEHKKASFILIILLLVLRFPVLFAAAFNWMDMTVATILFLCVTYLCTGIFICLNRGALKRFNFSFPALMLFFLAPIAALIADGGDPTAWARLVMAAGFMIFLYIKRAEICVVQVPKKKILPNCLFTLCLCIAVPAIFWAISGFPRVENATDPYTLRSAVGGICFQLSFAAASEEPLFRGFLWGYLRKRGMKEWAVCAIVALVFWFGHIYYVGTGINFWIVHPLMNLLLGIVIIKTKSISHTMVFHTCVNAFTDALKQIRL